LPGVPLRSQNCGEKSGTTLATKLLFSKQSKVIRKAPLKKPVYSDGGSANGSILRTGMKEVKGISSSKENLFF
jgi:hypothetical protein